MIEGILTLQPDLLNQISLRLGPGPLGTEEHDRWLAGAGECKVGMKIMVERDAHPSICGSGAQNRLVVRAIQPNLSDVNGLPPTHPEQNRRRAREPLIQQHPFHATR